MKATYPGVCSECIGPIEAGDEIAQTDRHLVSEEEKRTSYGVAYIDARYSSWAHPGCVTQEEPEPVNEACPYCHRSHVVGDEIAMWCEDVEANDDSD
jgi:hypothetical protein